VEAVEAKRNFSKNDPAEMPVVKENRAAGLKQPIV
jgi:hypothetical protein